MNLSYSSIQRYGYTHNSKLYGCPYSYYLKYIAHIHPTTVDSKYGNFGTVIHKILCEFYPTVVLGCIPNYSSPKEYFNEVLKNLLNKHWDYTLSETMLKDALSILSLFSENEAKRYENLKNGVITHFNPMHREISIYEPFNIRIDKVLHNHVLIDYKTTKHPPDPKNIPIEYTLQAGIYAIAYNKKYNVWPSVMIYHFLRTTQPLPINIDQQVIDTATRISNFVTESINSGKFPKNSANCSWCDMRHVCGLETISLW